MTGRWRTCRAAACGRGWEFGAHRHVARIGADASVDRRHAAGEVWPGSESTVSSSGGRRRAWRARSPARGNRHRSVEPLQRRRLGAGRDILAEVDIAQAQPPGEGRRDLLFGDDRPRALDGGGGGIAGATRRVDRRLRRVAAGDERPARSSVTLAFLSWASPLARSACSTESSRSTSGAPASTSSPESKWIASPLRRPAAQPRRPDRRAACRSRTATAAIVRFRLLDRHRVGFGAKAALIAALTMFGLRANWK